MITDTMFFPMTEVSQQCNTFKLVRWKGTYLPKHKNNTVLNRILSARNYLEFVRISKTL